MQTELLRVNKHYISVLIFVLLIEAERAVWAVMHCIVRLLIYVH